MANETQDMSAVIGGPAEEGSNVVNGSAPGTPGVETQQLGDIFVDDVGCLSCLGYRRPTHPLPSRISI